MRRAGGFHPATRILAAEGTLTREAVFQPNILDDGTAVLLSRVNGDLDRARRLIGKRADVLGYSIPGERESEGLAYVHTRSPEVIGSSSNSHEPTRWSSTFARKAPARTGSA